MAPTVPLYDECRKSSVFLHIQIEMSYREEEVIYPRTSYGGYNVNVPSEVSSWKLLPELDTKFYITFPAASALSLTSLLLPFPTSLPQAP